jgi:molybdate transport system substrate-binding protein
MKGRFGVISALIIVCLSGSMTLAQPSQTLIVFAAASLANAFEQVGADFEALNPGVDVQFSFASSSDLAAQLREGAPADIFASANVRQMTVAREAGRIAPPVRVFARNRLVVAIPADNPANITSLDDLAAPGVQLVIAAAGVPVRDYTDTMLERLAADPDYGDAYRQAVYANVVSEEQNVRQVAAKIALGEADAGIIYISDITPEISPSVLTLIIPDALNTIATYPIAMTDDSATPELARAFIRHLLGREGQAVLAAWNFIPVRPLPNTG